MSTLLCEGQSVATCSGTPCVVGRYLGGGGQGEVYTCYWGTREWALKWYYPSSATTEQRRALQELVQEASPGPCFLWPTDIAESDNTPGFGYVMRLREPRFASLNALMAGVVAINAVALIDAAIGLAKAMRALHTRGLCYRDISLGNAFIDPRSGDVLICDNDNIAVNRSLTSGVGGTVDFMAPEVLSGHAPSITSDQHSLAVLLFMMLCMGHPLMGLKVLSITCWDEAEKMRLFGRDPAFIFDPINRSNAAVEKSYDPSGEAGGTAIAFWRIYPQALKNTFIKAFTAGLRDPSARPTELEWLESLTSFRDALFNCSCGKANYYDPFVVGRTLQPPRTCWACGRQPRLPPRIRIGRRVAMLNAGAALYGHHLGVEGAEYDYSMPLAQVVRHPTIPGCWGLQNISSESWSTMLISGAVKEVEPGRSVPIVDGTQVQFGQVTGLIRS